MSVARNIYLNPKVVGGGGAVEMVSKINLNNTNSTRTRNFIKLKTKWFSLPFLFDYVF